jgi:exodeoxyribonuclease VII large subunit
MNELEDKVFKVSEFNEFINIYLSGVGEVVVEGEIADIKVSQNKWLFLTVKDELSSLDVFAVTYQISGYSVLESGMMVHIYGIPRLYQKTGKFSLYATRIVPAGEGALKIAFEKLKEKLSSEGLFNEERKRKISPFPEKIGLITAPSSRAFSDFVKVLKNRIGGVEIYFYPVLVQGKDSVGSIISAFNYFNSNMPDLDALVLVRGGGSLEDLQSFNDESLARVIFSSKIPVVCGVGHEDDVTIADLVCDLRASTPSNAAELLVKTRKEIWLEVNHSLKILSNVIYQSFDTFKNDLRKKLSILERAIAYQIYFTSKAKDKILNQFNLLSQKLESLSKESAALESRIFRSVDYLLSKNKERVEGLIKYFLSFDIRKTLARGFSLTFDDKGKIIRSINSISKKSLITTNLFDGKISSQVVKVEKI